MNDIKQILKETDAFLEGHFLLSSGKHSTNYVQCAKLLMHPDKASIVLSAVSKQLKDLDVSVICGPAMGGVIVSYELARQLNKLSIFTERENGNMTLRRGFNVNKGDKVIISEDVITTGKSTLETFKVLKELGADVLGVATIIDRTPKDLNFPLPIYSALKLDIKTYDKESCPICESGELPLVKPGSRIIF